MNAIKDTLQDPRTAEERAEPCGNCGHSRGNHRFHAIGGKRPCYDGDAAESCRCKAFVQRTNATFSDATTECEACGFPVRVLESHGVCIKGEHRGLLHPKCADFAFRIAALYEPPQKASD